MSGAALVFRAVTPSAPRPSLQTVVTALAERYPAPEPLTDPFQLIIWENIGYLIDDHRRAVLFGEVERRVGLTAAAIEAIDGTTLLDIAERGGMRPEVRVQRWRDIARITLDRAGGDLDGTLRSLPLARARSLLKAYPVIGDPGADKILLFTGVAVRPSLESNGVRALARLGYCAEGRDYTASYRAAIELLARDGLATRDWLMTAFQVLRDHGKALCKRGAPLCLSCPLDADCAHVAVKAL